MECGQCVRVTGVAEGEAHFWAAEVDWQGSQYPMLAVRGAGSSVERGSRRRAEMFTVQVHFVGLKRHTEELHILSQNGNTNIDNAPEHTVLCRPTLDQETCQRQNYKRYHQRYT